MVEKTTGYVKFAAIPRNPILFNVQHLFYCHSFSARKKGKEFATNEAGISLKIKGQALEHPTILLKIKRVAAFPHDLYEKTRVRQKSGRQNHEGHDVVKNT